MRTEIVQHNGVTVTVRSRNRRIAILEAQYMQALRDAYPDLVAFEAELSLIDVPTYPTRPDDLKDKQAAKRYQDALDRYQTAFKKYQDAIYPVRMRHRVGAALDNEAFPFTALLCRVSAATNWAATIGPDGRFDNASVVTLFEARLNDEDDPPDDLWTKIQAAVTRLDAPLTPVDERPPETLTEAESGSPLSEPVA